ncbi:MAG: cadmium resistance transporter [Leptolyngbya sp.]|nr:cadmium resistance transporter [Candidatus Melainabacteria bacterium]
MGDLKRFCGWSNVTIKLSLRNINPNPICGLIHELFGVDSILVGLKLARYGIEVPGDCSSSVAKVCSDPSFCSASNNPVPIGLPHSLNIQVQTVTEESYTKESWLERSRLFLHLPLQTYQVAAVTIANGGDNISIYVPLFANSNLAAMGVILSVFLIMIAVWCGIAYYLTRHAVIASYFTAYEHRLVPFVLIGLGVLILLNSFEQ